LKSELIPCADEQKTKAKQVNLDKYINLQLYCRYLVQFEHLWKKQMENLIKIPQSNNCEHFHTQLRNSDSDKERSIPNNTHGLNIVNRISCWIRGLIEWKSILTPNQTAT